MFNNDLTRFFCIGFPRWRAFNIKPIVSLHPHQIFFLNNAVQLVKSKINAGDIVVTWGCEVRVDVVRVVKQAHARLLHVEDGFVRSVGLGSDLIRPVSLVFDELGLYFDARTPSDIEAILNRVKFTRKDISRAKKIRAFIVEHRVSKYNIDSHQPLLPLNTNGKQVIFVPGQVEDDASLKYGAGYIVQNLALLAYVREKNPQAFIIYKPHPDVVSGNRKGAISNTNTLLFADRIEREHSVLDCIDACDEVHTMTSLTGFDALLRDKKVVTYGQPFYAGWGLTDDVYSSGEAFKRRTRKLNIDQLVAGALIHYPVYWDWDLRGYTTCEAALLNLVKERDALIAKGELEKLRVGFVRRQIRKLRILMSSYFAREI
jgi:capsular polysaccharide export protein